MYHIEFHERIKAVYRLQISALVPEVFSSCSNPTIHLLYTPKICIGIVLDFSWDFFMTQEKLQTMIVQNVGGGGGVKEVYHGICASRELSSKNV